MNTDMGSISLLQVIFPTQEPNQGLLELQVDSLPAELQGSSTNQLYFNIYNKTV